MANLDRERLDLGFRRSELRFKPGVLLGKGGIRLARGIQLRLKVGDLLLQSVNLRLERIDLVLEQRVAPEGGIELLLGFGKLHLEHRGVGRRVCADERRGRKGNRKARAKESKGHRYKLMKRGGGFNPQAA